MNSLLQAVGSGLLPLAEKLDPSDVAAITFTGLAVVFLGLIILIIFLYIMGAIFTRGKKKDTPKQPSAPSAPAAPTTPAAPKAPLEDADDDAEVVAVISAAIAAMGEAEGTSYAVKSIRKRQPAASGRPAWAMAGIRDNTTPF